MNGFGKVYRMRFYLIGLVVLNAKKDSLLAENATKAAERVWNLNPHLQDKSYSYAFVSSSIGSQIKEPSQVAICVRFNFEITNSGNRLIDSFVISKTNNLSIPNLESFYKNSIENSDQKLSKDLELSDLDLGLTEEGGKGGGGIFGFGKGLIALIILAILLLRKK